MSRPVLLVYFYLGALLLAGFPQVAAAAGNAVIHGASALNVRSGPGRDHPAFTTLKEGDRVEVEATEGSWVRIRTPDGQIGYVHKAFVVPLETEEAAAPPPEAEGEPASSGEVEAAPEEVPSEPGPGGTADRETGAPDGDVMAGQRRLERLVEGLQEDVGKLLEIARQRSDVRAAVRPTPTPTPLLVGITPVDATESGSLLGLSIIGLVAGFILGMIYGRRQERGRRTRVRF